MNRSIFYGIAIILLIACSSDDSETGNTATIRVNQKGVYTFYDKTTSCYISEVVNPNKYVWAEYDVILTKSVICVFENIDNGATAYSEINPVTFEYKNHYTAGEWKVYRGE